MKKTTKFIQSLYLGLLLGGIPLFLWSEESPAAGAPLAVPTFECVGLYWKPTEAAVDNSCTVHYRAAGEKGWKEALPLWFDPTDHPELVERSKEYRGSIVNLKSGTTYEIKLKLEKSSTEKLVTVKTWDEKFPILKTVLLKPESTKPITISEGGSASGGYVLYTTAPGAESTFDAAGEADVNIQVNASFVILRGLVLKGAKINGIQLGDVQDIVIEGCDISGWGRVSSVSGFGLNLDAAIFSRSSQLERVIVQQCKLHHPRSNSNSWAEPRPDGGEKNSAHPYGAQGISFLGSKGHFVIRHNQIYSDPEHKFNDGMGEVKNKTFAGFPRRDSDIYGNAISNVYDDGAEIEGANLNVRVWDNKFDDVYGAIGCATTSLGPVYLWKNVMASSRKGPKPDADSNRGAYFLKLGGKDATFTKGKIYLYHNTMLQPPARSGFTETSGGSIGINTSGKDQFQSHITSRNNILYVREATNTSIKDSFNDPTNDFDYDLYNGVIAAREGSESHGITGVPQFDISKANAWPLKRGSPGVDAGIRIPNFNDDFLGKAPDMGAFESHPEETKGSNSSPPKPQ